MTVVVSLYAIVGLVLFVALAVSAGFRAGTTKQSDYDLAVGICGSLFTGAFWPLLVLAGVVMSPYYIGVALKKRDTRKKAERQIQIETLKENLQYLKDEFPVDSPTRELLTNTIKEMGK